MQMRRVVITGLGAVAPNGIGIDHFWDSLVHGQSGSEELPASTLQLTPVRLQAEVADFDPIQFMDPRQPED